jgi:hypothetical protein
MPRLDRGIQYAAAVVGRAESKRGCSGILDRPVKPGDDNSFVAAAPESKSGPKARCFVKSFSHRNF